MRHITHTELIYVKAIADRCQSSHFPRKAGIINIILDIDKLGKDAVISRVTYENTIKINIFVCY